MQFEKVRLQLVRIYVEIMKEGGFVCFLLSNSESLADNNRPFGC